MADRQRRVFVGAVRQRLVDKQMPRRTANDFQHMRIGQTFLVQALDQTLAGTLRRHADAVALQVIVATHQNSPSSPLARPLKAS